MMKMPPSKLGLLKILINIQNFVKKLFMPAFQIIRSFLHQAAVEESRSTVLKPVGGILAMFLFVTLVSFSFIKPAWLGITFLFCSLVTTALYFFSYIYFMFKDKDCLRSEKYSLQKMAIEKNLFGDDQRGLISVEVNGSKELLPQEKTEFLSEKVE